MHIRKALLVLTLTLASAYASTYGKLPPLAGLKDLAALAATTASLPSQRGFVTVGEAGGRPIRLAFRHTKQGSGKWIVVMLHGLLSDSRAWRFVAGDLGMDHNLLLIDLMGCGRSAKPDPRDLAPNAYSPTALARQVLLVIRERSKNERIAVVGHSLGGMTTLRMLGDPDLRAEFRDVVERVERVILLASVDFAVERKHATFERITDLSDVQAALGATFGLLREETARSVHDGAGDPSRMPREEADRLAEILRRGATRHAAQEMIRQAVPFTPKGRPDWPRMERLVADYRNVDVPCLILWGARDETFPASMGYKLRAQLPRAWLRVLPGCMHQLPAEAPRACAKHIRGFVATAGEGSPVVIDGVVAESRFDLR
ncbi:MAG: alpha/beta hydrolase [Planctomycetota bacterium]|nr:alpha/beta hydrolase [Planctomycetota bacterium]